MELNKLQVDVKIVIIDPKPYQSTHFLYTIDNSPIDLSRDSQTSTNTSWFEESAKVRNDTKSESSSKVQRQESSIFQIYVTFLHRFSNYM